MTKKGFTVGIRSLDGCGQIFSTRTTLYFDSEFRTETPKSPYGPSASHSCPTLDTTSVTRVLGFS